ncbi:MAG: nucleotidyltransferase domain-containing protein [candidate division KSB1 bacterium]|nr:nucleotidyltransferase domain-containing protein [candidate division KSB1 bacterium]
MKDFDYAKARQFLEKKEEERERFLNERYNQACEDFQKIVKKIIKEYHPTKIYQWGSLLNREYFSEISDIDIALEGITSAEEIFKIYGDIMNMTDFSVDLIQLEKIKPEFAELIKTKGKIVYERGR